MLTLFTTSQLYDLTEAVREELNNGKLESAMVALNRSNKLETLLQLLDLEYLLNAEVTYNPKAMGKIVVIGEAHIKANVIYGIGKQHSIDKRRFELCLEYLDGKKYDYNKFRYSDKYAAIILGPMPHSTTCKGEYSSILSTMKNTDGFPPVIHLEKISKASFQDAMVKLISNGVIAA